MTTSRNTPSRITWPMVPDRHRPVMQDQAAQREDRGPDEGAGGHRQHRSDRRPGLVPQPSGQEADHDERERPATHEVVRWRRQVDQHAGQEADPGTELRPAHQRRRDHEHQGDVGSHAVDGDLAEDRGLEDDGDDDEPGQGEATQQGHLISPSAWISLRSPWVPRGTTTPTRSRALKSTNGSITACFDSCWGVL